MNMTSFKRRTRYHCQSSTTLSDVINCSMTLLSAILVVDKSMFTVSATQSPSSAPIVYNVTERQPVGTIVGSLASDIVTSTPSDRLILLNTSSANQPLFRIDEYGLLRTTGIINRDVVCTGRASCVIPLDVGVVSSSFRIVHVQVNIIDVNTCVPTFLQTASTVGAVVYHVSETTPPGVLFPLPVATDADSPMNGVVGYRLSPSTSSDTTTTFGINQTIVSPSRGDDSPPIFDVRLVLKRALDRQRQADYLLELIAIDGGSPSLSGTVQIEIVIDAAASSPGTPQFERAVYNVTVDDSASPGTTLGRVRASASDGGAVGYSFSSRSRTVYGHLFAIDSTSGDVSLLLSGGGGQALTYSVYNLSVEAVQVAAPQNSVPGVAALVVAVRHVNSHPPSISVDPLSTASGRPEVLAGSAPGTFAAFLTTSDPDQGANGQVTCSLVAGNIDDFVLVEMIAGYYKLLTVRTLYGGQYRLVVTCTDHGTPSLSNQTDVVVSVTYANYPLFSLTSYDAQVVSGGQRGDFVVLVQANDSVPSADDSGVFKYSLDDPSLFYVNRDSGALFAAVSFESAAVYVLHVTATNAHNLTSSAVVRVTVIAVNQISYLDASSTVMCSVSPATSGSGQPVCRPPSTSGRVVFYAVVNVPTLTNGSDAVQVDSTTGVVRMMIGSSAGAVYQITVKTQLDYAPDVRFVYFRFVVHVVDSMTSSLSPLTVTPSAASSPQFSFPKPSNNTVFVAVDDQQSVGGVMVTIVSAVGRQVSYSIIQNDTDVATYFVMSRDTGELRFHDNTVGASVVNRTFCVFVAASSVDHPYRQTVAQLNVVVGLPIPTSSASTGTSLSGATGVDYVIILAAVLTSFFVLVLIVVVAMVIVCRKNRRRRMQNEADRKLNGETFWARMQADSAASSSPSLLLEGTIESAMTSSTLIPRGANGMIYAARSPYQMQTELSGEHSPATDDDSGCAGFSNSTASRSNSSNSSNSDDGNDTRMNASNVSDITGGSAELMPLTSSTPQTSSAAVLHDTSSAYSSNVPDWLRTSSNRTPPEVVLTPPQSATAILKRTGSTCSRKSVRFADGELSADVDPKRRVHFATDRNQYLDPRGVGTASSSGGSDVASNDVIASYDDLGDGASEMSYTNSDCSSGLYVINGMPNGYRMGGASNGRQPIVAFRTFLPPDGSLV